MGWLSMPWAATRAGCAIVCAMVRTGCTRVLDWTLRLIAGRRRPTLAPRQSEVAHPVSGAAVQVHRVGLEAKRPDPHHGVVITGWTRSEKPSGSRTCQLQYNR